MEESTESRQGKYPPSYHPTDKPPLNDRQDDAASPKTHSSEGALRTQDSDQSIVEHLDFLQGKINRISANTRAWAEQLSGVSKQVAELKATDQVLAELSTRCRQLGENFYEREVLSVVFRCLIGIADKCRQQIREIEQLPGLRHGDRSSPAARVNAYLLEARRVDLVEVEDALANLAVEPFEHPHESFDPSVQKCINRIESPRPQLHGHVAARLLPGYGRNGKVIRPEYVDVYVPAHDTNRLVKGGKEQ